MCGIYLSTKKYKIDQTHKKLKRSSHRGPDYCNFIEINDVTLGHNRLSIIDLDARSNQPFTYHHVHIVFNGEIYNFNDIKVQLQKDGFKFSTNSDTEVICAAYIKLGEKCLELFNGMFSFVIYDENLNLLFGARDRLGKKPMYYSLGFDTFECSSQLSSILVGNQFSISDKAVEAYCTWGYIPEPSTIYNEVSKLRAGYCFTYDLNSKHFKDKPYWSLPLSSQNNFTGTYTEAKNALNTLLTDSVNIRLFADVPAGVFLSGGVDSSLISAIAASTSSQKINTFSVKFNENGFDESNYAKKISEYLGTNHHTIHCDIEDELDLLDTFTYHFDEPFSDSSALPSLLLAKYTKQYVTVALSGDGGDEIFLGYKKYDNIRKILPFYNSTLASNRSYIGALIKLSPYYRHKIIGNALSENSSVEELYLNNIITAIDKNWFNSTIELKSYPYIKEYLFSDKDIIERLSDVDIKTYLNGDINTKVDKASMAYSLEVRSPLMDYRVLEFAKSLPVDFKFHKGKQKRILRDLLSDYIPTNLFNRPKAGFSVPLKYWFRGKLKKYVYDILSEENIKRIPQLNYPVIKRMIDEHMQGKWNRSAELWRIIVLIRWMQEFDRPTK
ncbi:MAG: asparagine synthase (glutamine-hydrolyzing) [Bacteroidia bacterium]